MTTLPPSITSAPVDRDGIPIPENWRGKRRVTWDTLLKTTRMRYSAAWIEQEVKLGAKAVKPRRVEREKSEGYDRSHFTTKALRAYLWKHTQEYGRPQSSETYNYRTKRRNDVGGYCDVATSLAGVLNGHQAGQAGEEKDHWAKVLAAPGGLARAKETYRSFWWWEFERGNKEPTRMAVWW